MVFITILKNCVFLTLNDTILHGVLKIIKPVYSFKKEDDRLRDDPQAISTLMYVMDLSAQLTIH